jgi:2-oxoglutarate dehydrogenase E2 component (dihydrolipoamide succinyltransferase)
MATEIRVPALGESVTEAIVGKWFKKAGDAVKADEPLVELETDKVTLEVNAPSAGVISEIRVKEGETVSVGAVLGAIGEGAAAAGSGARTGPSASSQSSTDKAAGEKVLQAQPNGAQTAQAEQGSPNPTVKSGAASAAQPSQPSGGRETLSPAVRKVVTENNIDPASIEGSGRDGQILKGDVLAALQGSVAAAGQAIAPAAAPAPAIARPPAAPHDKAREERVRMTKLRQTIARRLKEAQNTAAMLTTFNEVDMSGIMRARSAYKDLFEKKHGVKLGFMGFFVKACIHALHEIPAVNAEVDGEDLVYKNYYNIGIAVGTERGLVVPVVRDADRKSIAGIEKEVADYGRKARSGKLSIEEMQGGTFTITNGGVYGSLMSTPILNAPQSGILGMHKIQERPVAVDGKIEIRPMMYLALTYDHRIVDGREAVTFLVRVKESIEDPQRLVLDL